MSRRSSFNDRLAVAMTRVIGTMPMFYALIAWYGLWIGINVALGVHAFDQPWSFPILLFISNFCQLIWLPALSVGQNVMGRASELQAARQFAMIERIDAITDSLHALLVSQDAVVQSLLTMAQADREDMQYLRAKNDEIDAEIDELTARQEGSP
jgi:uncharacterized membrane protein